MPRSQTYSDLDGLASAYGALVAAFSLFAVAYSYAKAQTDKDAMDAIEAQKTIYNMNRDWLEDELRALHTTSEAGKSMARIRQPGGRIRDPDIRVFKAYRRMLSSSYNLRQEMKAMTHWDLRGLDKQDEAASTKPSAPRLG
jgi:hypothetical protein